MTELVFRVDETKTGAPLELPITRQLAAILERRRAEIGTLPGGLRDWVFPSSASASGHVVDLAHFYGLIGEDGRHEVLVPRFAELFHHGGRARPAAAAHFDQAAGQPRPAQRHHRGIRGRLDHRATARTRAGHRRPDRCLDERTRSGCSGKPAKGGNKSSNVARVPLRRGPGSGRRDGAGHGAGSSGLGQARRGQSTCHSWDRRGGRILQTLKSPGGACGRRRSSTMCGSTI